MDDLLDDGEHPDPHDLFVHYNTLYFEGQLGAASVEWSSARMTRCDSVSAVCGFFGRYDTLKAVRLQLCWSVPLRSGRWMSHKALRTSAEGMLELLERS